MIFIIEGFLIVKFLNKFFIFVLEFLDGEKVRDSFGMLLFLFFLVNFLRCLESDFLFLVIFVFDLKLIIWFVVWIWEVSILLVFLIVCFWKFIWDIFIWNFILMLFSIELDSLLIFVIKFDVFLEMDFEMFCFVWDKCFLYWLMLLRCLCRRGRKFFVFDNFDFSNFFVFLVILERFIVEWFLWEVILYFRYIGLLYGL